MNFIFNILFLLVVVIRGGDFLYAMEWSPRETDEKAHSSSAQTEHKELTHDAEQTAQLINLISSACDESSEIKEDELIKELEALLKKGADINAICCKACNDTCFQTLVRANVSTRVLDLLFDHGARINTRNCKNKTALVMAVKNKNIDLCIWLLGRGAIDEMSFDFLNKLLTEIENNQHVAINIQLLHLLASYGCAQEIAFAGDWQEILQKLIPNELLRAIIINDYTRAARLLGHYDQSNIMTRTWYGKVVPLWAGKVSQENANVESKQGVRALWYAVAQGNVAIVKLLLEHNTNPLVSDNAPLRLINRRLATGGLTHEQRTNYEQIKELLIKYAAEIAMTFNRFPLPPEMMALIALELGMSRFYFKS